MAGSNAGDGIIRSFLMIGQSNMAGRGKIGSVPAIENKSIYMLRNGRWQPMHEPVNPDRPFSGISLAASFADEYARDTGNKVGLIPCADGGTCLNDWAVGGQLYDNAVFQVKLAMRISNIAGILWHQGESDSHNIEDIDTYESKFLVIIGSLLKELDIQGVPVILGELGEFTGSYNNGSCPHHNEINNAIHRIAAFAPYFAVARADGLKAQEDGIHFNAQSCREFGRRYFSEYKRISMRISNSL